ncbi:uracil-DNA glycosylase [Oceanihabitans sediminis]|uniref:Uracil-DNA glycosylase n=1 Tax=Oceanihabitans sediminis TaxID=1812012 RepID=A0A368P3C2_9FLAO|nr:uracil-DNA glycosylase [Oceanihabitans sediminis]MDX1277261.1 uracil-DNA glycosylase [Oceanihabitans sediminis]MDX1773680.1 uracil-DNA glycosylase [Oceanihabitans sediminis]RBP33125.1 uracil-DNA glycosylase [Oceanihabitans sediminis]RCU57367.1 uracil-DNA glycosylase [Oceanihabitans sediminis]
MLANISTSWKKHLEEELKKTYFKSLLEFITEEYKNEECFPKEEAIFNAFNLCPFEAVKVVIIGQDPYHDVGQANGLCFSVNNGVPFPPSLKNIFKELETDLQIPYPDTGNLEPWAKQGVLLLNATLTVRAHQAGSHQKKGWETFTDEVIKLISDKKEGVVFLLWGGFAKKKAKLIDKNKHHILTSGHPSPLSANRGYWFGNKHFSKTNYLLQKTGEKPLLWSL